MKQHTILLVACLMTIPAVAADDAGPCDDGSCNPSANPTTGPGTEAGGPGGCQVVTYWYQPAALPSSPPFGADLNIQCIAAML